MNDSIVVQVFEWLTDSANWTGPEGILQRTVEHIGLTAASLGIACALALPIGLWLGHLGRGRVLVVNVGNVGRAVPVFALLVLLAIGPLGLGTASTIVALTLFAIPPILTNAHTGVMEVDRDVVEAARGMGMSGRQVLGRVELPLASPLVMTGVRLSAVQVVATATVAALVVGGGLGNIIVEGFGRRDDAQIVSGAILVALLALAVEALFTWIERRTRARRHTPSPDRDPLAVATVGGA